MKKDQLLTRRRVLLAGAAALGAAGTAGTVALLGMDVEDAGDVNAGDDARHTGAFAGAHGSRAPLGGAPASRPLDPSAYRLRPFAGDGTAPVGPPRTPVRHAPLLSMPGHGRGMVLTFDDGPHPRYTPQILDTLREYDVRATFFVCGEMAVEYTYLLARMADEGHLVGNHTWSHPLLTRMSRAGIRSEMTRTSKVIRNAYGERPLWFRAPYGAWNRTTFRLGSDLGMEPLAWTVDTRDWTTPGTDVIVDRVEEGAAAGVVVLSHDAGGNRSQSVRALRRYLPWLLDSGYHLMLPRREFV
ncbi:peptidoglycan/xylan/chitin deacetylase (PgdA/CDA1 family) [Streptomyces sp. B3I7]|uniref:polysaccharide deacetylase family protein n=1 Tax=Streptomyces sp. B3I7 TaxID=3042269 RepID=UPI00277E66CB|nr:polysaccharide deacetylase family protein [Streptomyces sp. B3I7]MDQ0809553.1 peptidoglycan/xylan/chitin deacetylase (PgdA/CDA1 family) [Streptomyces sp. B3I7]